MPSSSSTQYADFNDGAGIKRKSSQDLDGLHKRPFICDTCGKRFTRLENLTRHKLSHDDTKNIYCKYCHQACKRTDLLKRHIQRHHSDVLPNSAPQPAHEALPTKTTEQDPENLEIVLPSFDAVDLPKTYHPTLRPYFTVLPFIPSDFLVHYIESYFEWFHPIFPMLHQPSFHIEGAAASFIRSISLIGCYSTGIESDATLGLLFWDSGFHLLQIYLQNDAQKNTNLWVIQTRFLLCISSLFEKTSSFTSIGQALLRDLVHDVRVQGWTALPPIPKDSSSSIFIEYESKKRTVYCIYTLEYLLAAFFNRNPSLSFQELRMPLPVDELFWDSTSSLEEEQWTQTPPSFHNCLRKLSHGPIVFKETRITGPALLCAVYELIHNDAKKECVFEASKSSKQVYEVMLQHLRMSMECSTKNKKVLLLFMSLWNLIRTYLHLHDPLLILSKSFYDLKSTVHFFQNSLKDDSAHFFPFPDFYSISLALEGILWTFDHGLVVLQNSNFDIPIVHFAIFRLLLQGLYLFKDCQSETLSSHTNTAFLRKQLAFCFSGRQMPMRTLETFDDIMNLTSVLVKIINVEGGWGAGALLSKTFPVS
ncbi:DNA-binding transcription factor, zf-fungal binuclear cluster type [Schizosaccharomyces osmophilus]|uniref:DNA-binding transcription factor, zf-fungal binuclear cluster type n=1 Tax=Schizosaccharomyces osmophilus TaxID=2545709 RepID=A0AAF0AWU6_9SCHI|nr:DNA-binding transcription factor, zf-fungal binuclear cluster type [Schizosaccharomyces osmophilus]WBW73264.1 DNA-binding transcription factor, zf-fungal binuclear cluster type [Schizosaccharomyces osmophilus]